MGFREPQTPGIGGLEELTTLEESFVQSGTAGVLILLETTAPSATANYGKFYVKASDSLPYFMNDSGVETAISLGAGSIPTQITVADGGGDTTMFVGLWTDATGDLGPKTDAGLTYNATTEALTTATFIGALTGNVTGNLTGNVTGNVSGSSGSTTGNAATVTTNANLTGHVTSVGNAAVLGSFTIAELNTAVSDANVATTTLNNLASVQIATNLVFIDDVGATLWEIKSDDQASSNAPGNSILIGSGAGNGTEEDGSIYLSLPSRTAATPATNIASQAYIDLNSTTTTTNNILVTNGGLNDRIYGGEIFISSSTLDTSQADGGYVELDGGGVITTDETDYATLSGGYIGLYAGSVSGSGNANGGGITIDPGQWTGAAFVGGNIYLDAGTASGTAGYTIVSTGDFRITSANVGTNADSVPTRTSTSTFTNKRVTPRVVSPADATSTTPNTDSADMTYQINTAAGGTHTVNADAGTPTNGQRWILKMKTTNVQTFSWNALYVGGSTVALPTSTSGSSNIDYIGFIYDTVDTKWHCVSVAANY